MSLDFFTSGHMIAILQIIWIDLLLSGDNAVVIALACRSLPPEQRRWGVILGAGAAIGLRIVFALIISELLQIPFLKVLGGVLLFWIAVKLIKGEESETREIQAADKLWQAVRTIAVADAVMSLDNVVAIAAAAKGEPWLFVFGLLLSIPLIMVGATLIMNLITKYPIFVWAGAALLGWIAGEMIWTDPFVAAQLDLPPHSIGLYVAAVAGAAIVVALGYWCKPRAGPEETQL